MNIDYWKIGPMDMKYEQLHCKDRVVNGALDMEHERVDMDMGNERLVNGWM